MPAARADHQCRRILAESVLLSFGTEIADGTLHRVPKIDLALDVVLPGWRVRILEVSHEDIGAGVQRIDDHFAVDRSGNLDAAVKQVTRNGRHLPIGFADDGRLRKEIRHLSAVDLPLHLPAPREQFLPSGFEGIRELHEKGRRFGYEDLGLG